MQDLTDSNASQSPKFLCPSCGEREGLPIVYGLPSEEAGRESEAGKYILGGCTIFFDSNFNRGCKSCGHQWAEEEGEKKAATPAIVGRKLDRKALTLVRQAAYIIDELRKIAAQMPIQQAATLMTVALRDGCWVGEVAELTGQTTASATRNLQALSKTDRRGQLGLDLVVLRPDPFDGRRKTCHLTPDGVALISRVIDKIDS